MPEPTTGRRVLLGVSGGIAAYKTGELIRRLRGAGHDVRVVATPNALRFVSALTLQTLSGHPVRSELFSPGEESEISHIELADWAEVVLIAPATAGLLARLAHGLADDLLATLCLATTAPLLLAPAMNVNMYRHPATQENLDRLAKRGARLLGPDAGELACGWEGEGRLVPIEGLVGAVERALAREQDRGEVVLVTAGPTAEAVDPVRLLTNRSSGRMGFALAEEAARRGAEVVLIAGPVSLPTPFGVERIDVESAEEMRRAVLQALSRVGVVIMAAAVADYRVAEPAATKLKRQRRETMTLELVRNPDILAEVVARRSGATIVGFAAETDAVLEHARQKLSRKRCDLIVANDVSRTDVGFDVDRNHVWILGPAPEDVLEVPAAPKREIAARILDRIHQVRQG
ncbi:MAG: bifunctional phosphopantothenoylcysteine decarboxylase/phosphopantothenate--cysteine ligase CoaBC [Myxococcota bacterium]